MNKEYILNKIEAMTENEIIILKGYTDFYIKRENFKYYFGAKDKIYMESPIKNKKFIKQFIEYIISSLGVSNKNDNIFNYIQEELDIWFTYNISLQR